MAIISTASLVEKVMALSESSKRLSADIACAFQDLKSHANNLAMLTRGSRSGEETTGVIPQSAETLARASSVIVSVISACDDYIRNAVR